MEKKHRMSQLLRRYVFCNLCLVLVPMAALVGISYYNAKAQVVGEYEISHEYALTQAMNNVDTNMESFGSVAARIAYDADLTPYQLRSTVSESMNALRRLGDYRAHSSFLDEILLNIRGDQNLYSANGVSSFSTFTKFYRFLGNWDADDYRKLLNKAESYGTAPSGCLLQRINESTPSLVITYPWSRAAGTSFGCVVGIINTDYFDNLLNGMKSEIMDASFILDSSGSVLFSAQNGMALSHKDVDKLLEKAEEIPDQKLTRQKVADIDCSVVVLTSKQNGWHYVSVFPRNQFWWDLLSVQTPVLIVISILLIVCIAIGLWMAVSNYLPIRRLNLMLTKTPRTCENELKEIDQNIQAMVESNADMSRRLDESLPVLRERVLRKLFTGTVSTEDLKIKEKMENLGIVFEGPLYCIAVLSLCAMASSEREAVISAVSQMSISGSYGAELDYGGYFAVLYNIASEAELKEKIIPVLTETLCSVLDAPSIIGVGHAYKSREKISRSLTEAVAAAESCHTRPETGAVWFDQLKTSQHAGPYWYPQKAQLRLLHGLQQGSKALVSESVVELNRSLLAQNAEFDAEGMRFVASGVIQQLWPLVDEYKLKNGEKMIDSLIHYKDITDFTNQLQTFCNELLQVVEQRKQRDQDQVFSEIINFINLNYCDETISLSSIAEMFGMTSSYLSRFFRENSGMNFIDYLSEKRMEKASELLKNTNMKIREIMGQVGYLDLASFTRKFTQVFGISPGRYRSS